MPPEVVFLSTLAIVGSALLLFPLVRALAERVRPWLDDPQPQLITYDSTRQSDILFGLGLGCRGTMELLIEPFDASTPPPLVNSFHWNGKEPIIWTTKYEGREILIESICPRPSVAIFGSGQDTKPDISVLSRYLKKLPRRGPITLSP